MELWLIEFINKYGYFAICFLIAFENIFPPIPSEIILTFGGFMTHSSNLEIPLVIIFSTIGSLIGALVLYFVGSIFNKDKIIKLLSTKGGRSLHIKEKDIKKADNWFTEKGYITVFVCRFIPIVRSLISTSSGNKFKDLFLATSKRQGVIISSLTFTSFFLVFPQYHLLNQYLRHKYHQLHS